ncbi:MAG: 4Fe-4S binding protein [Bacteroidetes bacterium]|nr:4Fe-4S binding protein [Bacteroidota bacterium]
MRQKKLKPQNSYRFLIQWFIIVVLTFMVVHPFFDKEFVADFEAYCPFGGMQAFSSFLANNTLTCSMTTLQISMAFALIIATILLAKLFCSYVCPIGTFSEWLGKLGESLNMRFTIKGFADRVLRVLKYALLFITFYFTISSSELFCKKYDPFYAIFSGFSSDVVLLYAGIAIAVMVLGAIFIRLFWCKYLCPLGAATNIFSNTLVFIAITGIYALLILVFKVEVSWVWYLGALCVTGFFFESIKMENLIFPRLSIIRDNDICTNCKKCDKVCPMAINVSEAIKVKHIDCHMCGDCIEHCPEKGALTINRRKLRWLPPTAVVVLVLLGIYLSKTVEIPTINERWGTEQQMKESKVFTQSGLKNIKCFGSSSSFVEQMREIEGVLGAETFVGTHTVKVYYDPKLITEAEIKKAIFSPTKTILNAPKSDKVEIGMVSFGLNHYFDSFDSYFLTKLLEQNSDIFAFETEFGEPVQTKVYFNTKKLNPAKIKEIVEVTEFSFKEGDAIKKQTVDFQVVKMDNIHTIVAPKNFFDKFYSITDSKFNKFDTYKESEIGTYQIAIPEITNSSVNDSLSYLVSHVSINKAIVGMKSEFTTEGPILDVYFVKGKIKETEIYQLLLSKTLEVQYEDGTKEKVKSPYFFRKEGKIIEKK